MSRIAEARARAGHRFRLEQNAGAWESEQQAAADLLSGTVARRPARTSPSVAAAPAAEQLPAPHVQRPADAPAGATTVDRLRAARAPAQTPARSNTDHAAPATTERSSPSRGEGSALSGIEAAAVKELEQELAALRSDIRGTTRAPADAALATAVRRVFLLREGRVRSVLICTPPGEPMSDVAWRVTELLAQQSARKVAYVEDPHNRVAPRRSAMDHLIARIGWYGEGHSGGAQAPAPNARQHAGARPASASEELGASVGDLLNSFDFAVFNATAPDAEDLVPLAQEVDGVIVLVAEEETRCETAAALVETLRNAGIRPLGAIFVRAGE